MTVLNLTDQPDEAAALVEGLDSSKGSGPDAAFRVTAFGAGLMVLVILALITITTTQVQHPFREVLQLARQIASKRTADGNGA